MAPPSVTPAPTRDPAAPYIATWQRRLPAFERGRRQFAGDIRQDPARVWVREHLVLGDRLTFDAGLQGLLTAAERQQLETNQEFTRAWRLFVDLCWMKKQVARGALVAGLVVVAGLFVLFLAVGLPEVLGPPAKLR